MIPSIFFKVIVNCKFLISLDPWKYDISDPLNEARYWMLHVSPIVG